LRRSRELELERVFGFKPGSVFYGRLAQKVGGSLK